MNLIKGNELLNFLKEIINSDRVHDLHPSKIFGDRLFYFSTTKNETDGIYFDRGDALQCLYKIKG